MECVFKYVRTVKVGSRASRVRFLRYSYATLNRFLNPTGGGLYLYLEIALKC